MLLQVSGRGPGVSTPDGVLPTLETVWWSSDEMPVDVALFALGGRASSHLALCYQLRKPLWITAKDGQLLVDAGTDLVDGWSRVTDLPPYRDFGERTRGRRSSYPWATATACTA